MAEAFSTINYDLPPAIKGRTRKKKMIQENKMPRYANLISQ